MRVVVRVTDLVSEWARLREDSAKAAVVGLESVVFSF